MTRAPAAAPIAAVPSVVSVSMTTHSAIRCHGILDTTWPIDSASFSAGIMTEIRRGVHISDSLASAEPYINVDLGIFRICGSLIVDLVVRLKGAPATKIHCGHGPDVLPDLPDQL